MHSANSSTFNRGESFTKTHHLLRSIAHPIRFRMIKLIAEQQPVQVADIRKKLKLGHAITSQHLRVLKDYQLVDCIKDGRHCCYTIAPKKLAKTISLICLYFNR